MNHEIKAGKLESVDGMTLDQAIEATKREHYVARAGWNGKGLQLAIASLKPFAEIGAWFFARNLPDDTPVVEIRGLNGGLSGCLTRGDFKAAFTAMQDACEGISTESLDHRSHLLKAEDDQITILTTQRDELLAVLREYNLPLTGDEGRDNHEFGVFQVARELRRRAAIAKVEGGAVVEAHLMQEQEWTEIQVADFISPRTRRLI